MKPKTKQLKYGTKKVSAPTSEWCKCKEWQEFHRDNLNGKDDIRFCPYCGTGLIKEGLEILDLSQKFICDLVQDGHNGGHFCEQSKCNRRKPHSPIMNHGKAKGKEGKKLCCGDEIWCTCPGETSPLDGDTDGSVAKCVPVDTKRTK